MPLINTSLPNLIQGVSQQPDAVRYDGQCEEQENALSSIVNGLQKRPPTEFIFDSSAGTDSLINTDLSKDAFFHLYKRSATEKYCITQDANILRIHNADTGVQCTVTEEDTTDFIITNNDVNTQATYLDIATAQQNLKALTIGDSTFVLNTSVATNNSTAAISSDLSNESLIFIKQGDYTKRYGVKINSTTYQIFSRPTTTANNSLAPAGETATSATKAHMADSVSILAALRARIGASLTNDGISFTTTQVGNLIHLKTNSSSPYTITGIDGLSGEGIGVVHRKVSSLADLPTVAPHNYKVKVIGDAELNQDDYYVKFEIADNDSAADDTIGEGSWVECAGGLIPTQIDSSLMPRMLVSTALNTFVIRRMAFNEIKAGDLDSNPYPSFLGNSINNLFQYKNRLGFLALDNICLSEAGFGGYNPTSNTQSYNFFRTSVTDLLDADPIDVTVASNDVTNLRSAQPFQENLILFSDNAQFVLKGGDLLTPKTVSVTAVTNFDAVNTVEPIPVGSYLYFPFQRGAFSGLREFTVNASSDVYDSNEITAHVPQYIPNELTSLTGSNSEQLIALTSGTTVASAQNTQDTSIIYNNYGSSKYVDSTNLVLHVTSYMQSPITVSTGTNAIHAGSIDNNIITEVSDASGSQFNMRGVSRTNTNSLNSFNLRDAFAQTLEKHTGRTNTGVAHGGGISGGIDYHRFRGIFGNTNSCYAEFSEFYYPTKWAEYTSQWDAERGFTVEWFGALSLFDNQFSTSHGQFLWNFNSVDTSRSAIGADYSSDSRPWHPTYTTSVSQAPKLLGLGYDHNVYDKPELLLAQNGGVSRHSDTLMMTDYNQVTGQNSVDGDELSHFFMTGTTSQRRIYRNNNLIYEINAINNTMPTLYSLRNNIKEIKLSMAGSVSMNKPIYFRIYNKLLTSGQRGFNFNNRFTTAQ